MPGCALKNREGGYLTTLGKERALQQPVCSCSVLPRCGSPGSQCTLFRTIVTSDSLRVHSLSSSDYSNLCLSCIHGCACVGMVKGHFMFNFMHVPICPAWPSCTRGSTRHRPSLLHLSLKTVGFEYRYFDGFKHHRVQGMWREHGHSQHSM